MSGSKKSKKISNQNFGPVLLKDLKDNPFFRSEMSPEWVEVKKTNTDKVKVVDLKIERPWYVRLKGKHGDVYPISSDTLGAYVVPSDHRKDGQRGKRGLFEKLKKIPGVTVRNNCDHGEGVIAFPWEDKYLLQVGELLRLKKFRKTDAITTQKRAANIKKHRFIRTPSKPYVDQQVSDPVAPALEEPVVNPGNGLGFISIPYGFRFKRVA